jgi:hypothetical protein
MARPAGVLRAAQPQAAGVGVAAGAACVRRARARVGVRAVRGSGRQRQASLRSDQVLSRDRWKPVVLLRSRHDAAAASLRLRSSTARRRRAAPNGNFAAAARSRCAPPPGSDCESGRRDGDTR